MSPDFVGKVDPKPAHVTTKYDTLKPFESDIIFFVCSIFLNSVFKLQAVFWNLKKIRYRSTKL